MTRQQNRYPGAKKGNSIGKGRVISRFLSVVLVCGSYILISLPSALAEESPMSSSHRVIVSRAQKATNEISEIKFSSESTPEFQVLTQGKTPFVGIRLEGKFTLKDGALLLAPAKVITPKSKDGKFEIELPLESAQTSFELITIDPYGETKREVFKLQVENPEALAQQVAKLNGKESDDPKNPLQFQVGLGMSFISYSDPRVDSYTESALTLKGSISKPLGEQGLWDIGGNFFYTALPISQSEETTLRFLGLNLRVGRPLAAIEGPWKLSLHGGYYYITMFATPANFGFQHMGGPQIFPSLSYAISPDRSISSYVKYSPVQEGFGFSTLRNRELAIGLGYHFKLGSQKLPFSITLDHANLQVEVDSQAYQSQSTTFGVNYQF